MLIWIILRVAEALGIPKKKKKKNQFEGEYISVLEALKSDINEYLTQIHNIILECKAVSNKSK